MITQIPVNTSYSPNSSSLVASMVATEQIRKEKGARRLEDNRQSFDKGCMGALSPMRMRNMRDANGVTIEFVMDFIELYEPAEIRYERLRRRFYSNGNDVPRSKTVQNHFRDSFRNLILGINRDVVHTYASSIKEVMPEVYASISPHCRVLSGEWVESPSCINAIERFLKSALTLQDYVDLDQRMLRGILRFACDKMDSYDVDIQKGLITGSSDRFFADISSFSRRCHQNFKTWTAISIRAGKNQTIVKKALGFLKKHK